MAKGLQARLASQGSFLSDDESDDEAMRGHGAATNDESGGGEAECALLPDEPMEVPAD